MAAHSQADTSEQPGNHYCSLPEVPELQLPADVSPERSRLIQMLAKKWVNGTTLRYYFFDQQTDGKHVTLINGTKQWRTWTADDSQKNVVRQAFDLWKNVGIGLTFQEVDSRQEAEIRIGFMRGDGAWSYVGRDIIDLNLGTNNRTMNFGWDLTGGDGLDTAVHEIGHTIGFPHEHQNPNAGIEWDEDAVYSSLAKPPNSWSRATTFYNIIRKIAADEVQGSNWDPDSIMHYPFEKGLIKKPEQYRDGLRPAGGLSDRDKGWVRFFYPPLEPLKYPELKPFEATRLSIPPGEQMNFAINPQATRDYDIRTFGESDTVIVLFEDVDGDMRFTAGDDDSGEDYNASLRVRLFKGRKYVLRVRLYYAGASGETAVMMW